MDEVRPVLCFTQGRAHDPSGREERSVRVQFGEKPGFAAFLARPESVALIHFARHGSAIGAQGLQRFRHESTLSTERTRREGWRDACRRVSVWPSLHEREVRAAPLKLYE
jgi:hypothetical protein